MNRFLTRRFTRFLPFGLMALAAAVLLAPAAANATPYKITLTQVGPNVVASGSGSIDLTGLSSVGPGGGAAQLFPSAGIILTGPAGADLGDVYTGLTGPLSFGSGSDTFASSGGGDVVGINSVGGINGPSNFLIVPTGYASDTGLTSGVTFDNASFASLGVTPGTYVWTWGTAADRSFTLMIGGSVTPVPEPAVLGMFGLGVLLLGGFVGLRRRVA